MINKFRTNRQQQGNCLVKKTNALAGNKQSGFTLVIVLILSGLASILVLNSLKDNVNQERLSGNFQKKLNSRLASERGLFESMTAVSTYLVANPSASLADLVSNGIGDITDGAVVDYEGMKYTVDLDASTADEFVLSSVGNRFEGQSTLKMRLKFNPGTSSSSSGYAGFSDAIVGCDGVNLAGSGEIDSYNSNEAQYDEAPSGNEGDVSTINHEGADVILTGGTAIQGNISATGSIQTGSSSIDGNLHANGNIEIGNSSQHYTVVDEGQTKSVAVTGNILTRGDYYQYAPNVAGYVLAMGNAGMAWTTSILNINNNPFDIQYGGNSNFEDDNSEYRKADYNKTSDIPVVISDDNTVVDYDPKNPETNCDHLEITSIVDDVRDTNTTLENFDGDSSGEKSFELTPNKLTMEHARFGVSELFTSTTADVLGNEQSVIMMNDFELNNDMTISGGDVTLFVENDFTMGGAGLITIEAGSSLTLIIKGKVILGNGADIIPERHGLADGPNYLPAMSIYSSYESDSTISPWNGASDPGITISGDFSVYAQVYAPLADVNVLQGGTLYGAVRGKTVNIPGGAAIHYDAALGEGNRGGSDSSTTTTTTGGFSFLGFEY